MGHYVDRSTQTIIEGLARDPAVRPAALIPHTDTTTPPDDMAIEKLPLPAEATHAISNTTLNDHASPTLLLRRKNRPLVARISLPSGLDAQEPSSPPPTETILSPLPAANTLHAGHTPIIPRARSPLPHEDSEVSTPDHEEPLSGPLTLPPQPGDGADDTIPLSVLNAELEKLRIEQEKAEQSMSAVMGSPISPDFSKPTESEMQRSAQISPAEARRASAEEIDTVDGVILKKPKMNMGAPLGQV